MGAEDSVEYSALIRPAPLSAGSSSVPHRPREGMRASASFETRLCIGDDRSLHPRTAEGDA